MDAILAFAAIVQLSSFAVFDRSAPCISSNEPVRPNIENGQQKANVEQGILTVGKRTAVVRWLK